MDIVFQSFLPKTNPPLVKECVVKERAPSKLNQWNPVQAMYCRMTLSLIQPTIVLIQHFSGGWDLFPFKRVSKKPRYYPNSISEILQKQCIVGWRYRLSNLQPGFCDTLFQNEGSS